MISSSAHHRFEEHTGEVVLVVEAASLAELFAESGRALAELLLGDGQTGALAEPELVELRAADPEALLVDWLNELIYRSEVRKRVYLDIDMDRVTDHELRATLRGARPSSLKTQVKAATYHKLRVAAEGTRFVASVILDV
jgi:SHS2 domain-containing protein